MQYLNDDMDELFRRAAENYPLNTNSANWNEVQKKLSAAGVGDETVVVEKKKFNKSLLLLLLLIPAIWIYVNSVQQQQDGKMVVDKSVSSNGISPNSNVSSNKVSSNDVSSNNISSNDVSSNNISPNNVSSSNISPNNISSSSASSKNKIPANTPVSSPLRPSLNESRNSQPGKSLALRDPGSLRATVIQPAASIFEGHDNPQSLSFNTPGENKTYEAVSQIPFDESKPGIRIGNQKIVAPILSADINNMANPLPGKTAGNKKEQKKERPSLYAGIIFSPDVSIVYMQRIKNMGTGFGLKLGYQFNKKISLESGILFDKKIYYSSGEYVNTKRISVPNYSSVKDVNGVCRMIEIPMDIKFNISKPGKTVFSATAGVASYFMQKEIYDYTYEYSTWQAHGRTTYKKSSSDLLAVMNFSVGYNHKVNKKTTLMVSPYLKIPFKGVGIGSLPITSTGVNIGIIRDLFTF
jgi:hypothetical protein